MSVRSQTSRSVFPMKVSLDDGIDILDRNAVEVSPVKQIFGTVRAILALVRVGVCVLRSFANLH